MSKGLHPKQPGAGGIQKAIGMVAAFSFHPSPDPPESRQLQMPLMVSRFALERVLLGSRQ